MSTQCLKPEQFLSEEGIRKAFNFISNHEQGFSDAQTIREAFINLNLYVSEPDSKILVQQFNQSFKTANKEISYDQFLQFVRSRELKLAQVFCQLDINANGIIEKNEIQIALQKLGHQPTNEELDKLITSFDPDHCGAVDFHDFRKMSFLLCKEISVPNIVEAWRQMDYESCAPVSTSPNQIELSKSFEIILAGGIAGAISRTATSPMERLKVLWQVEARIGTQKIDRIIPGFKAIYQEGGWKGFFKGNGTNVIKIMPESAVKFFSYEIIKQRVAPNRREMVLGERIFTGALAGVISQTMIYPLEITKTRLAVATTGTYRGIFDCLSKIYRSEGPFALYRGLTASLAGIIPYAGVDMGIFFTLKETWLSNHPGEHPGMLTLFLMGAGSSFCGQVTAYPLQLIRTKLQSQGMPGLPIVYKGPLDCVIKVVKESGPLGLYRGITPNCMKAIPAVSISYVVYEQMRVFLGV